jgi:hypothetical protein
MFWTGMPRITGDCIQIDRICALYNIHAVFLYLVCRSMLLLLYYITELDLGDGNIKIWRFEMNETDRNKDIRCFENNGYHDLSVIMCSMCKKASSFGDEGCPHQSSRDRGKDRAPFNFVYDMRNSDIGERDVPEKD